MSTPRPLTIMFWPESAFGPTNQYIPIALADVDGACRAEFSTPTPAESARSGTRACTDPSQLRAFRAPQVLREMIYAAGHLPHWMYVPDAALPALLDEGTKP